MKNRIFAALLLLIFTASLTGCGSQRVSVATGVYAGPVSQGFFWNELSPYGRWVTVGEFGWVWTPAGIPLGWRPYSNGYWSYTDWGWTWVSYWPWGWAPFHYGRWTFVGPHGWCWVPGYTWGPAWVAWRHGPGWVGWAPLPPRVRWHGRAGLDRFSDSLIDPKTYSFVDERRMTERKLDPYIERESRNATLMRSTRNVTDYADVDNRIVNRGIDVERIEKESGRKISRQRIVDADKREASGESGETIRMYRPRVEQGTGQPGPPVVKGREAGADKEKSQPKIDAQQQKEQRKIETQQAEERRKVELQRQKEQRKLETQQAKEKRKLEAQQEQERKALEKQHKKERKKPPAGVPNDQLQKRQTDQQRTLQERQTRDRQALDRRQQSERNGRLTPKPPKAAKAPKPTQQKPAKPRKPEAPGD